LKLSEKKSALAGAVSDWGIARSWQW